MLKKLFHVSPVDLVFFDRVVSVGLVLFLLFLCVTV